MVIDNNIFQFKKNIFITKNNNNGYQFYNMMGQRYLSLNNISIISNDNYLHPLKLELIYQIFIYRNKYIHNFKIIIKTNLKNTKYIILL